MSIFSKILLMGPPASASETILIQAMIQLLPDCVGDARVPDLDTILPFLHRLPGNRVA